jgi:hypothetical protein
MWNKIHNATIEPSTIPTIFTPQPFIVNLPKDIIHQSTSVLPNNSASDSAGNFISLYGIDITQILGGFI